MSLLEILLDPINLAAAAAIAIALTALGTLAGYALASWCWKSEGEQHAKN